VSDPFLRPSLAPSQIDRFLPRQAIFKAIQLHHAHLRGRCLDVGCGDQPYRSLLLQPPFQISELLGLDRAGQRCQHTPPDLEWHNGTIPLPDGAIDSALCTEVLEHCPHPGSVLAEVHRVLKPGGSLLLTVPFLWPLHEVPHDWCRYTPFALRDLVESAGFQVKELRALGGYDRSLAQMLALWLRRRPMNRWLRAVLTLLAYPLWTVLRCTREPDGLAFAEGQMITGLVALAQRPNLPSGSGQR
jgi:SAM-dependent methyltransferase